MLAGIQCCTPRGVGGIQAARVRSIADGGCGFAHLIAESKVLLHPVKQHTTNDQGKL